jgi:hypothetical protein
MDRALRGKGLLGGKAKRPGARQPKPKIKGPPHIVKGKEKWDRLEAMGTYQSGGIEGKPHSTWKGRMEAGKNWYNRAWGQKYYSKPKKKGIPV